MSATNFNTRNDTYRKLMGNGLTYRIPRFQRDYSWAEEEWEELWQDLLGTMLPGGEPAHYLGNLVLQSRDEKSFDVIDGQQRLTTLSLMVLAALKQLHRLADLGTDADNNRRRAEQIRQSYIGYLDPVTLIPRSKLTLNRNNDDYYQAHLVPLGPLPQRGFKASEHALRKAFEWFDKRLGDWLARQSGDPGQTVAHFVETMSDKFFFTVITVTDELNAYKVFETLNARGVRLSATDLLKNFLFSVLQKDGGSEQDFKALEDRWEKMVGRLSSESFPDFLRAHWNSRFSLIRQTELFKTIRGRISGRAGVFELIRDMEADVDVYLGLVQPEASDWAPSLKQHARQLRLFGVRQPFPVLMAAHRHLSETDFASVLRASAIISFRYNVIGGLGTSEQESVYAGTATKLARGELKDGPSVLSALATIYPGDPEFKAAFAAKALRTVQSRNRKIVRYILCELERQATGTDLDFESDTFNLEHVLPENPGEGWEEFSENEIEALVYRLGNLTLLARNANQDLGNQPFPAKRAVYFGSRIGLTRKLAEENGEWTPARLAARQTWMATQATAIWRIDQLARGA